MESEPTLRLLRPVVGTTLVLAFGILVVAPLLEFASRSLYLVTGAATIVMAGMLVAMRHGASKMHGYAFVAMMEVLIWGYVAFAWFSEGFNAMQSGVAFTLILALPFLPLLAYWLVAGATLVIVSATVFFGALPPDEQQNILLFSLVFGAFCGVLRDLLQKERNERKIRYQELMEEKAQVRDLLASSQDAIASLDKSGRVIVHNDAAKSWLQSAFGTSIESGEFLSNRLPDPIRENYIAETRAALAGESRLWQFSTGSHNFEASLAPLHGTEESTIRGTTLCVRDITERLRHKEQLESVASQTRSQILNMVTHQLNTPLTPILLESAMLSNHILGDLLPPQDRAVNVIRRNAVRAMEMVDDIIEASREDGDQESRLAALLRLDSPGFANHVPDGAEANE